MPPYIRSYSLANGNPIPNRLRSLGASMIVATAIMLILLFFI